MGQLQDVLQSTAVGPPGRLERREPFPFLGVRDGLFITAGQQRDLLLVGLDVQLKLRLQIVVMREQVLEDQRAIGIGRRLDLADQVNARQTFCGDPGRVAADGTQLPIGKDAQSGGDQNDGRRPQRNPFSDGQVLHFDF